MKICLRTMIEALAVHEMFRRLGYKSGEIVLDIHPTNIQMVLRAEGKEFIVGIGKSDQSTAEAMALWRKLSRLWNSARGFTDELRYRIWEESKIRRLAPQFIDTLIDRGFNPILSDEFNLEICLERGGVCAN